MANWTFLPLIKKVDEDVLNRWVGYSADPKARSALGEKGMSLTKRKLALAKIESETSVRKHPVTGEREFLLHRTAGDGESKLIENNRTGYNSGGKNASRKIGKDKFSNYTSWSTAVVIPHRSTNHCISAWVPESKISFTPNQYLSKIRDSKTASLVKTENEAIVAPGRYPIHHHTYSGTGLTNLEFTKHINNSRDKVIRDHLANVIAGSGSPYTKV